MAIIVFQHEPLENAARLGETLAAHGHRLRVIRFFEEGASVPVDLDDVDGLVVMGGNMNVDETEKYPYLTDEMDYIKKVHAAKKPVVGVCLGAQLIAVALEGEVGKMEAGPELGFSSVKQSFFATVDTIFAGIPWEHPQFHMHGYEVTKTPPGGTPLPLTSSVACKNQAFKAGDTTYAFQYHFEWTREDLLAMLDDPFIKDNAGEEGLAKIKADIDTHYENYRRLGDRLCARLAMCLFPVDKRQAG